MWSRACTGQKPYFLATARGRRSSYVRHVQARARPDFLGAHAQVAAVVTVVVGVHEVAQECRPAASANDLAQKGLGLADQLETRDALLLGIRVEIVDVVDADPQVLRLFKVVVENDGRRERGRCLVPVPCTGHACASVPRERAAADARAKTRQPGTHLSASVRPISVSAPSGPLCVTTMIGSLYVRRCPPPRVPPDTLVSVLRRALLSDWSAGLKNGLKSTPWTGRRRGAGVCSACARARHCKPCELRGHRVRLRLPHNACDVLHGKEERHARRELFRQRHFPTASDE